MEEKLVPKRQYTEEFKTEAARLAQQGDRIKTHKRLIQKEISKDKLF